MLPPDDVNPEVVESPTFVERNFPFWAIIVSLVVTLPLLTTKYLTLFDYPNHVARYGLLSQFQDSPVFRSYFQVNNRFIPNLGFDFLAVNLGKWMSVVIASQLILATSVFSAFWRERFRFGQVGVALSPPSLPGPFRWSLDSTISSLLMRFFLGRCSHLSRS